MTQAQIVMSSHEGYHNGSDFTSRLIGARTYEDLSTIIVCPTRGVIPAKVVQNWMGLMNPMNQKLTRVFMIGLEVGEAYNQAISAILASPELSTWKYVLTIEEDNLLPPDAVLKLLESIKDYDAVGALYWTKGPEGQPMCYGSPDVMPKNFIPQIPAIEALTPCNGLGMGCTLFRLEMFKKMQAPWFETVQRYEPGTGVKCYTQDLHFFEEAGKQGFKFACDSRVKVGHYDAANDMVW